MVEYIKASKMSMSSMLLNGGEVKFGSFYVDGYYEINGDRVALEYLGASGMVATVALILAN